MVWTLEPTTDLATAGRQDIERLLDELPSGALRKQGELAFDHPWQVRTLAIVVHLHEQGRFAWPEFQSELIDAIAAWEALPPDERPEWSYYSCWQQAAERVITKKDLVTTDVFDLRAEEFLSGKRTPPHTHGGGLLATDPGGRA